MMNNRPIIFAELSGHFMNGHGYGIREVAEFLKGINYETWPMISKRFIFKRNPDFLCYKENCLLVPAESTEKCARFLSTY